MLFDLGLTLETASVQVWQNFKPGIFCQSLTFARLAVLLFVSVFFCSSRYGSGGTFNVQMHVFDQCTFDWTLFIGIVAYDLLLVFIFLFDDFVFALVEWGGLSWRLFSCWV